MPMDTLIPLPTKGDSKQMAAYLKHLDYIVRRLMTVLPRDYIKTDPDVEEKKIISMQRNSTGKLQIKYIP